VLRRLGVADQVLAADFLRHLGHWVTWDGPPRFVPFGSDAAGPWRGFQAWRPRFDAILLDGARRAGAGVRQACPAVRAHVEGGRVQGAETYGGLLRARYVVDGTGRRRWLARQLRLRTTRPGARLVAWYGYAGGSCPERDQAPALVADAAGWTWTARVQPRVYQWTRLPFRPSRLAPGWLPPELRDLSPVACTRAADVSWSAVDSPAGPGYILVGDAAAVLDPLSSHGVLRALLCGLAAGHVLTEILGRGRSEMEAGEAYARMLRNWFATDVAALQQLYARLPCPPCWSSGAAAAPDGNRSVLGGEPWS
jgi:flavin-dependent dehydrogenase